MSRNKDSSNIGYIFAGVFGAIAALGAGVLIGREVQRSQEEDEYEEYERAHRERPPLSSSINTASDAYNAYANPYSTNSTNSPIKDEDLCKVCLDQAQTCVLLPCRHQCVCPTCATQLTTCPICRSTIDRTINVFKS